VSAKVFEEREVTTAPAIADSWTQEAVIDSALSMSSNTVECRNKLVSLATETKDDFPILAMMLKVNKVINHEQKQTDILE
jgi:hypothetical protein